MEEDPEALYENYEPEQLPVPPVIVEQVLQVLQVLQISILYYSNGNDRSSKIKAPFRNPNQVSFQIYKNQYTEIKNHDSRSNNLLT